MRVPSRNLTAADAGIIKALVAAGWLQSDIASLLGCNIGRVSEIANGLRFADVHEADTSQDTVRARIAEIQAAWALRISRQVAALLKSTGAML